MCSGSGSISSSLPRAPGVTAAVHGPDANPDVVGVDIRLDELLLSGGLSIGQTGRAYIVAKNGEMVAGHDPTRILQTATASWRLPTSRGLATPTSSRPGITFVRRAQETASSRSGGRRLISISSRRLPTTAGMALADYCARGRIRLHECQFAPRGVFVAHRGSPCGGVGESSWCARGYAPTGPPVRLPNASSAVQQQSAAFARLASEAACLTAAGTPPKALTETLAEATAPGEPGFAAGRPRPDIALRR